MDDDKVISISNLNETSKKQETIYNSVVEMQTEMRSHSREFYYRLAILAGSVLSLSVTYLGFLSSKNITMHFIEFLFLAWIALTLSLFGSLYRNHFNLDMGHWQTILTLNQARLESFKASLVVLEKYPQQFINLKTSEDVKTQIDATKKNITTIEKAIKNVQVNERNNSRMWRISQFIAHVGFLIGIVLISLFAAINLPLSVDYTITNWIKTFYHT